MPKLCYFFGNLHVLPDGVRCSVAELLQNSHKTHLNHQLLVLYVSATLAVGLRDDYVQRVCYRLGIMG